MTVQQANQQLLFQLYHVYEEREAKNIADLVMEHVTEWKRIDRIMNKTVPLSPAQEAQFNGYISRLLAQEPVQYVLHEAWFYGTRLWVDEQVLIPRPETEELVGWIAEDLKSRLNKKDRINILDVGTGSGCIAIALKKTLSHATVYACDVSEKALAVARKNATANGVAVSFTCCDFLHPAEQHALPRVTVIVSNPPYIPHQNKAHMHNNVLLFEPHVALFVPDEDPLVFYEAITRFSQTHLAPDGTVYVEIHEDYSEQVILLFSRHYAHVVLRKDLQGKQRMIKATGQLV